MSPRRGILETCFCTLLSMSPARTKVWPSASWSPDSALRLFNAGIRNPERMTALAKSSSLTSWDIEGRSPRSGRSSAGIEPDAELLVDDGKGGGPSPGRRVEDDGELPTHQEFPLRAVGDDEVRLRKSLQPSLVVHARRNTAKSGNKPGLAT